MNAADVVVAYLRAQAEVIASSVEAVRADAPDAVHRTRVASRRTRSALRTFRGLFRAKPVGNLRRELAWHADRLGAARDTEVLREHLVPLIAPLDAQGAASVRLQSALAAAHAQAHDLLVESMRLPRYDDLLAGLADFVTHPPLRDPQPVATLASYIARAVQRARRLEARAVLSGADQHRWHEVRKAAKAVRYCAEAVVPAFGEPAARLVAAWEAVTEALGEYQDTAVAQAYLASAAGQAHRAGHPTEVYLNLIARHEQLGVHALHSGRTAVREALSRPAIGSVLTP